MNMKSNFILILLSLSFILTACSDDPKNQKSHVMIHSNNKWSESSTAGNLIATAIKEVHDLDMVFYPTAFLNENSVSVLKLNMSDSEINNLTNIYPSLENDQFLLGSMKGSDIEKFMFLQAESNYRNELHVAGLKFDYKFVGGLHTVSNLVRKRNLNINRDHRYRVAISKTFFFSGKTAPGYLFGYGFNFVFKRFSEDTISAKESLRTYVKNIQEFPHLLAPRGQVTTFVNGSAGRKSISQIQGAQHVSPLRGYTVTTQGIITAIGFTDRYPGGYEIYIQSLTPDKNDATSEAIYVYVPQLESPLAVGDVIEVSGVVYEDRFNSGSVVPNGLTRTAIKEVSQLRQINAQFPEHMRVLPTPTLIGVGGRKVPNDIISSYNSNLNNKKYLNLNDGIDFWESLESMTIQINQPKVVGFSGGNSKFEDKGPKSYLNIFITPDSHVKNSSDTPSGGVIIKEAEQDFNPHIITLETHHLTRAIDLSSVFNVGDKIDGSITGLFVYERSFFRDGHYALLLTEDQSSINNYLCIKSGQSNKSNSDGSRCKLEPKDLIVPIEDRPKSKIEFAEKQLTLATYNIENLSKVDDLRLKALAGSIHTNLNCPDIVNLVEIQDNNGISLKGGSDATETLQEIIKNTTCPKAVKYEFLNINPFPNGEGGQPGGNIRMSMLYNVNRVSFIPKINNDPFGETFVNSDGQLSNNPGRLYPNDKAFRGSRKSLIAEFLFRGQRVVVIGNHFNSKLGDSSLWGAIQPPVFRSETRRTRMAAKLNSFVENLIKLDPNVNVIVAGDFNAHLTEKAMVALEGDDLKNLINYKDLIPPNDRYTTNYNGNSQGLDYILANNKLLGMNPKVEILHINSDYMNKHSDHDPVIAGFTFE